MLQSHRQTRVLLFLIPYMLTLVFLSGCPRIERDAYLAAVGAKAFLGSEYGKHQECLQPNPKGDICEYLGMAVKAKDLLVDAGEVYCGGPGFLEGGACHPPQKSDSHYQVVHERLVVALTNYEQIEKDLKALLAKGETTQ